MQGRIDACLQSSNIRQNAPHTPCNYGLAALSNFILRRKEFRNHRHNDVHAHVRVCYATSDELGSLISSIKCIQAASTVFMDWWKKMCAFYWMGHGDPTRLPISFLIQAMHTREAWAVLRGAYARGSRSLHTHMAVWRTSLMDRVGGVPIEVTNPDFMGNPMDPAHYPIPDDHPDWLPPDDVPLLRSLPVPHASIGNGEDAPSDEDDY